MQIQDIWYPIKELKRSGTPTSRFLDELGTFQQMNAQKNITPVYHYCEEAELHEDQQHNTRKSNSKNDEFYSGSNTNQIIEELRNIITDQLEESRQKELEQQKLKDLKLLNTNTNSLNVKEMPLNPFDFIWFNNLVPKQDELNKNNIFEAMYEEYAFMKNKSMLSAENKSQNTNNSNWSFSSSNNPLFSDDYTLSNQSCMSKCAGVCGHKKKKDKKSKMKKSARSYVSKSVMN